MKSFLAIDFGANTLKLAEFEQTETGGLRLINYGLKSLGLEGAQEASREAAILKGLQGLLTEGGFASKSINVCAPGFHVFSKFVKLPPVDTSKVTQIIQYEAQQNVPFPLEEVVWDYQILGTTPTGELEVLLVAIKSDIVEGLFRVAESSGLRLQLVDASPAALCNAFRYNYGDLEGCTMLLDIGAKTSNLLFFEKGKVFSRSINIGANAITQEFATESKLPFAEADRLKIAEGFVSLGGAYEEPENPHQAAISKIARQVMTRLHIQVNQTMQFYRGQQGGSPPQRVFLSGGASIMPYTAQFFQEKLNVTVEYFNPFRNVEFGPAVNLEELQKVAHSLGEVVGLALRNLAQCPVELNLMPKSLQQRQLLSQKKPYFVATVFSLVLVVFAFGFLYDKLLADKQQALQTLRDRVGPLEAKDKQLTSELNKLAAVKREADQLRDWVQDRMQWADLMAELQRIMMSAERTTRSKFKTETGIWIEKFVTISPRTLASMDQAKKQDTEEQDDLPKYDDKFADRYNLPKRSDILKRRQVAAVDAPVLIPETNSISMVTLVCRALDVAAATGDSGANKALAFELQDQLKASVLLDPKNTELSGSPAEDPSSGTFTFAMVLKLKRPMVLQ